MATLFTVTAVKPGDTTITFRAGDVEKTIPVTVTAPALDTLTVSATPNGNGWTLAVTEPVTDDCQRRYRVETTPTPTTYDMTCAMADGWAAMPTDGIITGTVGQTVTVVDCTIQGAKARAAGTSVLEKAASKNLLAYGPVTNVNGFTTSVNDAGELVISGTGLTGGKGVAWPLDVSELTPGYYTLSCTPAFKEGTYAAIWAGPISENPATNRLSYIPAGITQTQLTITADNLANGLRFGLCRFFDSGSDLPETTLRVMLQPSGQSAPWEKPDDVNATEGGGLTQG